MRFGTPFMSALLAGALALPLATATPLAEAAKGKKHETITRTITNNGQISVPNPNGVDFTALPYPARINVGGFKKGKIKDVDVILKGMSHGDFDEFDIMLVKGDTNTLVVSDVATGSASNVTVTIDDEAAQSMPQNGPLTSGRFKPTDFLSPDVFPAPAPGPSNADALSVFDGLNPNGEWELFIVDDTAVVTGSIADGWALKIKAKVKAKK